MGQSGTDRNYLLVYDHKDNNIHNSSRSEFGKPVFVYELGRCCSFASEQNGYSNTTGGHIETWITLDGTGGTTASDLLVYEPVATYWMLLVAPGIATPTEGYHYTVLSAAVSSGTTVTYGGG